MTALLDHPTVQRSGLARHARRVPGRWRLPLAVFLGVELVLLLWWAAFYPGLTSYDSAAYVAQVTTGYWSSEHSVLYNVLVWLALHVPGKLAVLTLAQTLVASATLAYTCVAMRALGARARWLLPIALLVAAAPPAGAFVVYVWKDVPFTLCTVLTFAASARLIAGKAGRYDWWVFALSMTGMGLFRNNGLGVALIAGLALVLVVRGRRLALAAITLFAVGFSLVCQLAIYPALGIKQPAVSSVYSLNYHDVAVAYAKQPDLFTDADKAVLAQVTPLADWTRGGSNCYVSDQLVLAWNFDRNAAERVNTQLMDMWSRVLKERPDLIMQARICRGHIAWAPFPGPADKSAFTWIGSPASTPADLFGVAAPGTPMAANPNRFALYSHPVSYKLRTAAQFWYSLAKTPQLDWLLFRGATWCYVGYAALFLYAKRRQMRAVWVLGGVLLGFQLTVLAANPAPLYRYMVGPFFVAPFLLALIPASSSGARGTAGAGEGAGTP
ncbi:hypothetical protein CFP65_2855 [Kitasatospora sp. MMS16-BH015]|uniref:hypothetical protein n=1 Tax=Kitasatospora sp. MMS16-BH015 TaxID=2018025 RepID=UPI000CA094E7|nr:hypothetical protein [Kitasatospora sp. MMS16-BH015]AUG77671.1 hypothetical protein CFP65_2855 [Kitasatospora sp. MMS16-BH015]